MTTWDQIDFLPPRYREQHAKRRNMVGRLLVLAAYVGLLAAGSVVQRARRAEAAAQLARAQHEVLAAQALSQELAAWQQRLLAERACAELITYLEHPWPRTQLLAAILPQLPESIHLSELRVFVSAESQRGGAFWQQASLGGKAEKDPPPEPAGVDLARLRTERDAAATYIHLSGIAQEQGTLHSFLHQLSRDELFAALELISIESLRSGAEFQGWEFQARIKLKPGYGQTGGPQGQAEVALKNQSSGPPVISPPPAVPYPSRSAELR